ncbi:hypothetical protein SDC9_85412 [bioreactor metagenome]|uniref:Uncharacterized protein n=1 Tax=bioreactor metagenome TaxID=1076179 RepID=A0A644ZD10_9ZZZZ
MDVGHVRSIRWVKDDNPNSVVNSDPILTKNGKTAAQNRWIAYNKSKGQYTSAMEHAVPEQFWVDKTQCRYINDRGVVENTTLADCAQGISAVKAIAIAQSQGQKLYTINPSNRDGALPKLRLGGDAGAEIRSAIEAGKEVTFHESQINSQGWHGIGYIIIDPDTGAGSYLIEGAGNGGVLLFLGAFIGLMIAEILIMTVATVASGGLAVGAALILAGVAMTMLIPVLALTSEILKDATDEQKACFVGGLFLGLGAATFSLGAILGATLNRILFYIGVAAGIAIPSTGDVGSCVRA